MCTSALASEFREDCKFYTADKEGELHKFMWLFKDQRLTVPHWQNQRSYLMAQKVMTCLTPDPLKQEPLVVENAPDPLAGEQTWPTEAEMAEAERNLEEKKTKKKRMHPKGISEYQAAWIVDNSDIDYSDSDEVEDDGMVVDDGENGFSDKKFGNNFEFDEDQASLNLRDSDEETETDSVLMEHILVEGLKLDNVEAGKCYITLKHVD
ncbi:hypothetical protein ACS0TY_006188 [Phlomoides rotata]